MNTQLVEIASWRIVSELHRRYPDKFQVIETHPGGGQYDCLALYDEKQRHIADFNRRGRLHVSARFDDNALPEGPLDVWSEMVNSENPKATLDKISAMIGLPIPSQLSPSTPTTLVYRFISTFLTHSAFGIHKWECRNGYEDTSGYGGGVVSAFAEFPQAQERLKVVLGNDISQQPAYRFWFLYRESVPVLCFETTGIVWTRKRASFSLMDLYRPNRRIWQVVLEIAGDLLP